MNTGSAQPMLTQSQLRGMEIISPPEKLQTQFAQIVEKTEVLKAQYKGHLQELEQLYGALSQRAFRGG
jgi:type I restriction enzyme S subunit